MVRDDVVAHLKPHMSFEKESELSLAATTSDGEVVTIPPRERLHVIRDLSDWRRVAVQWREKTVVISRTAWTACRAIEEGKGRQRAMR